MSVINLELTLPFNSELQFCSKENNISFFVSLVSIADEIKFDE